MNRNQEKPRTITKKLGDKILSSETFKDLIFRILSLLDSKSQHRSRENSFRTISQEDFKEWFTWKRVAIVWNAPLNKPLGEKIDSYDIVIRINLWWFSENLFDESTWVKTSLHAVWSTSMISTHERVEKLVSESREKIFFLKPSIIFWKHIRLLWNTSCEVKILEDMDTFVSLSKSIQRDGRIIFPTSWLHTIDFVRKSWAKEIWLYWFSFCWVSHRIITWRYQWTSSHAPELEEVIVRKWIDEENWRIKINS